MPDVRGVQVRAVLNGEGEIDVGLFGDHPDVELLREHLDNWQDYRTEVHSVTAVRIGYRRDRNVWGPGFAIEPSDLTPTQLVDVLREYLANAA